MKRHFCVVFKEQLVSDGCSVVCPSFGTPLRNRVTFEIRIAFYKLPRHAPAGRRPEDYGSFIAQVAYEHGKGCEQEGSTK